MTPSAPNGERHQEAIATCEVVEHTIIMLQSDRQTFERFRDGATASEAVMTTHFPPAIARWYSQTMLNGLRRLDDRDERSHSLWRLFHGMIRYPDDWTFDAVFALWRQAGTICNRDPEMLEFLAGATYEWAADSSGRALSVARVKADRDKLVEIIKGARHVVNKTIAHADRKASAATMTFKELHDAIYAVEDLAKRYIALVTGRGYSLEPGSMTPVEQTPWHRIFEPWRTLDRRSYKPRDLC